MTRILMIHNRYQQAGGEDIVFEAEAQLLASRGHLVVQMEDRNERLATMNLAIGAAATLWNEKARRRVADSIRQLRPDILHFHNTFPLISPAAYYATRCATPAVVQTLHNFRLVCVNGLLFREGKPCEDCVDARSPWPGALHGCYRKNRAASSVTAAMLTIHKMLGTWNRRVDAYIAPSEFAASILRRAGLPVNRIFVKPNFVDCAFEPDTKVGEYMLFVGRLTNEKGVMTLLDAWDKLSAPVPLHILGSGPLEQEVRSRISQLAGVLYLGQVTRDVVVDQMRGAAALVFPSLCYEVAPVSLIEALAAGRPSIVSGHGAAGSLIEHQVTGLHFRPGDAAELAKQVDWAWSDQSRLDAMRRNCRALFERSYTAEANYKRLVEIYERAITARAA